MSRTAVLLLFVSALAGCSCSDAPPVPSAPAQPGAAPPAQGTTAPPAVPPPAEPKDPEERARRADEYARGLLKSFDARVYAPPRDAALLKAEGEIVVTGGGRQARYGFSFDASAKPADQVRLNGPPDTEAPPGISHVLVTHWAIQSLRGAALVVAWYKPPIPLLLTPSNDGKQRRIVWAQPYQGNLNVSYSFDDRDLITLRGEWTDAEHKAIASYDWELWHGHYLLRKSAFHEGAATAFEYDDREGINLLRVVRLTANGASTQADFAYRSIVRSTPK